MLTATVSDGCRAAAARVVLVTIASQPPATRPQCLPWRRAETRHSTQKLSNGAPSCSSNYACSCARPFGPSWHQYGALKLTSLYPCYAGSFTLGRQIHCFEACSLPFASALPHMPIPCETAESWLSSAAAFSTVTTLSPFHHHHCLHLHRPHRLHPPMREGVGGQRGPPPMHTTEVAIWRYMAIHGDTWR